MWTSLLVLFLCVGCFAMAIGLLLFNHSQKQKSKLEHPEKTRLQTQSGRVIHDFSKQYSKYKNSPKYHKHMLKAVKGGAN